ncbi:TIGR02921 family PEP-CTERM protein [Halodesulfovibrio sp.]|uniref:TIGR02921 family PEP-CTERM protein n=1 Tax=Halodesulfovibrio sp. TaxID=1912772 RepID=UPI0025D81A2A|nr:TIGR02921 family PEP-CTERM protein [Halodesulfovibrio sp.]MCT4534693.1 TIGR02921 family PEP-CTERM protein [Halodesulfovibrio sp.]
MKNRAIFKVLVSWFFWVWHGIILFLGGLLILAIMGKNFSQVMAGTLSLDYFVSGVGLLVVPLFLAICGGGELVKLEQSKLLKLVYVVELPLLILLGFRFFGIDVITIGDIFVLTSLAFPPLVYLFAFLADNFEFFASLRTKLSSGVGFYFFLVAYSMLFVGMWYSFAFVLLIIPPLLGSILGILGTALAITLNVSWGFIVGIILFIIFVFLFALVAPVPLYLVSEYSKLWSEKIEASFIEARVKTVATFCFVVVSWFFVFVFLQSTPQDFDTLVNSPPQNEQQMTFFADNKNEIRGWFLEEYIAQYNKYRSQYVYAFYYDVLGSESMAEGAQAVVDALAKPMRHKSVFNDIESVKKAYAAIFDVPMLEAEKATLEKRIGGRTKKDVFEERETDVKRVLVDEQTLSIQDHGYYANVKMHECYKNQTYMQREVEYYFAMPDGAVVTDLKMGLTESEAEAFRCVVAPRGAARKVYENEVRKRRDPALLEQIDDNLYRLRIFPVPAMQWDREKRKEIGSAKLFLWMTFQVLRTEQGFPMPRLLKKRNAYWIDRPDRETETNKGVLATWLPEFLPSNKKGAVTSHMVMLPEGYSVKISPKQPTKTSLERIAVVLDSSYSMHNTIGKAYERVRNGFKGVQKDVYVVNSTTELSKELDITISEPPKCFGSSTYQGMIREFNRVRKNAQYDAIFLLTDDGSYWTNSDEKIFLKDKEPLWLVHLGKRPFTHSQVVKNALIKTGGGVIFDEQLTMDTCEYIARAAKRKENRLIGDVYEWHVQKQRYNREFFSGPIQLAAQKIIQVSKRVKEHDSLEALHTFAQDYHIVSPYSSMLVLVNEQQEKALKNAEQGKDKFDRDDEWRSGKYVENSSINRRVSLSAVPEPHEWVLIILGTILLFALWRRERIYRR